MLLNSSFKSVEINYLSILVSEIGGVVLNRKTRLKTMVLKISGYGNSNKTNKKY